jgi:hypothetical protein
MDVEDDPPQINNLLDIYFKVYQKRLMLWGKENNRMIITGRRCGDEV